MGAFKGGSQCLWASEVRFNHLVTEISLFAGLASQGADVELPTFLKRAHDTAALISGRANDGDDLL